MRIQKKRISDGKLAAIIAGVFSAAALIGVAAAIAVRLAAPAVENSSLVSSEIPKTDITSSSIPQTETVSDTVIYETDEGTSFNVPDEMRAVYLKPGQDFLLKNTDSVETIKSQIDSAMKSTAKLGFNSVIIFTKTTYGVLFEDSELKSAVADFDVVAYALNAAKEQKLYTYVVYPVFAEEKDGKITEISDFSKQTLEKVKGRAAAFAKKYQPSAVIFDNYTVEKSDSMTAFHEANGNGKPIEDYLREQVTEAVRLARNAVRQNNKVSQIGFLASSVWANSATNQKGSNTSSDYESYIDGFADTRDFALNQKFNFVMVENLMPTDSVKSNFKTIAQWWSELCSQADIPFYNVHASSKLLSGPGEFLSPDQLIRQVSILQYLKTYCGSVFDSLSALTADKEGSTSLLLKYFDNQIEDNLVFSKLKMSKPTSNKITTYDGTILFAGATDPNFKTTFNGQNIEVTEKGYFSIDAALEIGTNTFKVSHKGTTVTYTVVRKVKLLESITPTGTLEVDGNTNITISVKAFTGSSVTAKINGTTVKLTEKKAEDVSDETVQSNYVMFEGTYKAPDAIETVQNLGKISVTAAWQGYSENMSGATIKVYAKPKPVVGETQKAVMITAQYAETFPTSILSDQSQPNCYPLPAGTIDYVVGNELIFNDGSTTYKYYKLQSGHRVYSKDTKTLGEIEKKNNKISAVNLSYDGRFVNLKVDNGWSVPFKYIEQPEVSYRFYKNDPTDFELKKDYQITKIVYRFFYTDEIDLSNIKMDNNPLVSKVECVLKKVTVDSVEISVCDIELTLKTAGGFFGATPSYTNENKTLDIRLNVAAPIQRADNAYGYTLKGAVIIVDAGHNKTSPGAIGYLEDKETGVHPYSEYVLNAQVRDYLVSTLKSLGATVITINNEKMPTAAQRLEYFQSVDPHLMICIHHNDSTSSYPCGAVGTYFNAYSQLLSKSIMTSVCGDYLSSGSNRAYDYYFSRLKMTREQYYPSVLIECGFMSNAKQLEELIVPENQQKIANNIVKGLINYFVKTGSLNHAEFENTEDTSQTSSQISSESSNESSGISVDENMGSSEITQTISDETVAYLEPKRQLILS